MIITHKVVLKGEAVSVHYHQRYDAEQFKATYKVANPKARTKVVSETVSELIDQTVLDENGNEHIVKVNKLIWNDETYTLHGITKFDMKHFYVVLNQTTNVWTIVGESYYKHQSEQSLMGYACAIIEKQTTVDMDEFPF